MACQNIEDYGALDSGDKAAEDYVVIEVEFNLDGSSSVTSGIDESEQDEEQDVVNLLLTEEFVSEFRGLDAVLAGYLNNEALKNFATAGWGSVEEPDVFEEPRKP